MERLGTYASGPIALAALGVILLDGVGIAAAIPLWALAGLWAVVAVSAWHRARQTLRERAIRVANRVRRCVRGWNRLPDFEPHSAWGLNVSQARMVRESLARQDRPERPALPYTPRLHRKVEAVIEALGAAGISDPHLGRFLTRTPDPNEYDDLARGLWWAGCKVQ
jgi:hypothetical protein